MKPVIVASLFALILAGSTAPGAAEPFRPVLAGLPPPEIVAILRAGGFEPTVRPVRGAGVFYVRALAPDGEDVRVTVHARTGRVLRVQPMGFGVAHARPVYGPPPVHRGDGPLVRGPHYDPSGGFEDARGAMPVPPRAVPGAGSADVDRRVTPLPRPRPNQIAAAPAAPTAPRAAETPASAPAPATDAAPSAGTGPAAVVLPPVTPLE